MQSMGYSPVSPHYYHPPAVHGHPAYIYAQGYTAGYPSVPAGSGSNYYATTYNQVPVSQGSLTPVSSSAPHGHMGSHVLGEPLGNDTGSDGGTASRIASPAPSSYEKTVSTSDKKKKHVASNVKSNIAAASTAKKTKASQDINGKVPAKSNTVPTNVPAPPPPSSIGHAAPSLSQVHSSSSNQSAAGAAQQNLNPVNRDIQVQGNVTPGGFSTSHTTSATAPTTLVLSRRLLHPQAIKPIQKRKERLIRLLSHVLYRTLDRQPQKSLHSPRRHRLEQHLQVNSLEMRSFSTLPNKGPRYN